MLIRFYNLRVGRAQAQVTKEVRALLAAKPQVLGFCEATGYVFPAAPGYTVIRDRSTPGRANIAAYVRGHPKAVQWHDCKETWGRTEHPGEHPARAWVEFRTGGVQVLVGHQPPKYTDNTIKAQQEGVDLLTARMGPWTRPSWRVWELPLRLLASQRPRLVIMDANRGPNEPGPGPTPIARNVRGKVVGHKIDVAVVRNGQVSGVAYRDEVAGVKLLSDHDEEFEFWFDVPARWEP